VPTAVCIRRDEHSVEDLRRAAARCRDSVAARRMLALALVKDGASRADAARACGMDCQTLRDWVHRYNADGLAGLTNRHGGGGKPRLNEAQREHLAALVRTGPNVATHGVVRWRRIDLARAMLADCGVIVAERTVGKLLRGLGFRRVSVRPQHPAQDPAVQEAHKKTLPTWLPPASRLARMASQSNSGGKTKPASASKAR